MGLSPKRRWLMVTPPVFLESYWKYAWMYLSVWSPMILVEFLLAPTVPSPPRPQNLHSLVPGAEVMGAGLTSGRLRLVTSSTMPRVKRALGSSLASSVYTAKTLDGGVSLEPRP